MSDQKVLDYVIEKTQALMNAPSCCSEAKEAAQAWLDAVGTEKEAEAAQGFIAELEADIIPIDDLIAFMESENGVRHFGEEAAAKMAVHGREIKDAGAKYCDCPACAAACAILEKKDILLG